MYSSWCVLATVPLPSPSSYSGVIILPKRNSPAGGSSRDKLFIIPSDESPSSKSNVNCAGKGVGGTTPSLHKLSNWWSDFDTNCSDNNNNVSTFNGEPVSPSSRNSPVILQT